MRSSVGSAFADGAAAFALATDAAVRTTAHDLGINAAPGARVYLLPCIAGHVGADTAGVILAEEPQLADGIRLIVDVGTNAEIVLGKLSGRHGLKARLDELHINLENTVITSPVSGFIGKRVLDPGALVTTNCRSPTCWRMAEIGCAFAQ